MAIIDVIKCEVGNDTLVWKHPREDFNASAQLVVHETQEAIVFKDGQASNPYMPGKYILESENIPGVRKLVELITGGISPNHCEVYFINKAYSMNIFWGTNSPMIIQDPVWQIPLRVRANGQLSVKVENSKKLLLKIVGTSSTFNQKTLTEQFRGLLMSNIKNHISNQMVQEQKSFMEISSFLSQISDYIKSKVSGTFENYGLSIEDFFVESINVVEDDNYTQVSKAMADRAVRNMGGVDENKRLDHDVALAQASNPGSGGISNAITGAAVGMSVGPIIGQRLGSAMQSTVNTQNTFTNIDPNFGIVNPKREEKYVTCTNCGKANTKDALFCNACGNSLSDSTNCPKCGRKISTSDRFCSGCGNKIGE